MITVGVFGTFYVNFVHRAPLPLHYSLLVGLILLNCVLSKASASSDSRTEAQTHLRRGQQL